MLCVAAKESWWCVINHLCAAVVVSACCSHALVVCSWALCGGPQQLLASAALEMAAPVWGVWALAQTQGNV
jgi:hypothetical protein